MGPGKSNGNFLRNSTKDTPKGFWSQLDAVNNKANLHSSSTPPEEGSSFKRRQQAAKTKNHSQGTDIHHRKIANTSILRSRKAILDDTASQQSSVFEAFEVAPLRTIANDNINEATDTSEFLNDSAFGVHHAYVKRCGLPKSVKKVGFPETLAPLHESPPQVSKYRKSTPVTNSNRSSVDVHNDVSQASNPQNSFEVMLQARHLRQESSHLPIKRHQPPPPPVTSNRKFLNARNLSRQEVANRCNGNGCGKHSSHQDKIKLRIKSSWKKMAMVGGTRATAPSSANNNHDVQVPHISNRKPSNGSNTHQSSSKSANSKVKKLSSSYHLRKSSSKGKLNGL